MDNMTGKRKLFERPSLKQYLTHAFFFIFSLPWILVILYVFKPIANEILPVSFSNLEQGKEIIDNGFKYQIIYIGGERFLFPKTRDFIYKGGFFKNSKENDKILIRLYWPDILPEKAYDYRSRSSSNLEHYFASRMWIQVSGSEKPINHSSQSFWKMHPDLQPSEYISHDDNVNGMRFFNHKKQHGKGFSYSLRDDKFVEFYGGMVFYYKPTVRVSIGGYGYPSVKDIHGNSPKWQDIYQGVVSVLDRYCEVEHHASR